MSIAGVIINRLLWLIRLVSSCFRRSIECLRFGRGGASRIGELPYVRPVEDRIQFGEQSASSSNQQNSPIYQHQNSNNSQWNNWDDKTFGIQTKIDEYRSQFQQQKHPASSNNQKLTRNESIEPEPDLFSDLQPTLKATKTYRLNNPAANAAKQAPRQSLFEVKEMDPFANRQFSNELGEIDLNASTSVDQSNGNWGEDELPDLDQALNDQKRKEITEKQRQRREEHEKRLQQKRQNSKHN